MNEVETTTNLYDGWAMYQKHIVTAVAPLTEEQLGLRAAPHLRTVESLVRHIIGARARWFNNLMGVGGDEVAALATTDRAGSPQRSVAELVSALETTWAAMYEALNLWTAQDMAFIFEGKHGGEDYRFSRQWVVWHVLEHDLSHGGELFLTLGMYGLPTPDL